MRVRWLLPVGIVLGCGAPANDRADRADGDADTDADSDSDADTDAPTLAATCAPQSDNVLRVDCDVTVAPPGPVEVTFAPADGGPPRTMAFPDELGEHAITLWRMTAETTYDYTVTSPDLAVDGTFATGALPAAVDVAATISGGTTASEDVLLLLGCDGPHAVALAPDGRPVWYQPLAADLPGAPSVQALVFTPEREIAAVVAQERVRRFALDGDLVLDAVPALGKPLHHDLFVRDGLTWVLDASTVPAGGETYVVDGVSVLDSAGAPLAEWELADLVAPFGPDGGSTYWDAAFPGAIDWSHGNGLYVDEVYELSVSFYGLDAVVRLAGDPDDPAFGTARWVLTGSGLPFPPSDFAIVDPSALTTDLTFHAHHPTVVAGGELQLFDNGQDGAARVLRLALDEPAAEAAVTGSWPLGAICPIGGGAFELSNGNLLATCATEPAFYEIDPATAAIVRTVAPICADGFPRPFPRAIPVTL